MRTVAALYVDRRGPYYGLAGVDCWDEERDARLYHGPHPVVAHPPCGPWGVLAWACTMQDATLAPLAVEQVARWGGVLEHPRQSGIWKVISETHPHAGHFVDICQVWYGHRALKRTRLWLVGVALEVEMAFLAAADTATAPTASVQGGAECLTGLSRAARRATPPRLAEWLVRMARSARAR